MRRYRPTRSPVSSSAVGDDREVAEAREAHHPVAQFLLAQQHENNKNHHRGGISQHLPDGAQGSPEQAGSLRGFLRRDRVGPTLAWGKAGRGRGQREPGPVPPGPAVLPLWQAGFWMPPRWLSQSSCGYPAGFP